MSIKSRVSRRRTPDGREWFRRSLFLLGCLLILTGMAAMPVVATHNFQVVSIDDVDASQSSVTQNVVFQIDLGANTVESATITVGAADGLPANVSVENASFVSVDSTAVNVTYDAFNGGNPQFTVANNTSVSGSPGLVQVTTQLTLNTSQTDTGSTVTYALDWPAQFGTATAPGSFDILDVTAPTITSTAYDDADADGTVDTLRVRYSEDVETSTFNDSDWAVITAGDVGISNLTNVRTGATNDEVLIDVDATPNVTGPTTTSSTTPRVEYTGTSIVDAAGNQVSTGTKSYTDVADPVVESTESLDTDGDGQVDTINVTFTELISNSESTSNNADADNFTLGGADSGSVTVDSLTIPGDGPTVSLGVTGPADNTNLSLTLDYTASSLRRNGANIADTFSGETVHDGAAPVVSSFSLTADDANEELDVSFDSTETLSTVSVSLTGPETATLTSFTTSGATHSLSTSVSTNGDYTATLDTADDAAGNSASSTPSDTATVSFVSTATPTPTPTATPDSRSGGGSSFVSALSGTGSKVRISGSTGLLEIGVSFGGAAGGTVRASEVTSLSGETPPGTFATAADITVPDTLTETASTVKFAISRERLTELGIDPTSLTVYRFHDGSWEALETRVVAQGSDTIVIEADTPGFSLFAVMADGDTATSTTASTSNTDTDDGDSESASDASSDSSADDDTAGAATQATEERTSGAETTETTSSQTPGFGVGVALVSLLAFLVVGLHRRD